MTSKFEIGNVSLNEDAIDPIQRFIEKEEIIGKFSSYMKPYIVVSGIQNSDNLKLRKFKDAEATKIRLLGKDKNHFQIIVYSIHSLSSIFIIKGFDILDISENNEVRFEQGDVVLYKRKDIATKKNVLLKGVISNVIFLDGENATVPTLHAGLYDISLEDKTEEANVSWRSLSHIQEGSYSSPYNFTDPTIVTPLTAIISPSISLITKVQKNTK